MVTIANAAKLHQMERRLQDIKQGVATTPLQPEEQMWLEQLANEAESILVASKKRDQLLKQLNGQTQEPSMTDRRPPSPLFIEDQSPRSSRSISPRSMDVIERSESVQTLVKKGAAVSRTVSKAIRQRSLSPVRFQRRQDASLFTPTTTPFTPAKTVTKTPTIVSPRGARGSAVSMHEVQKVDQLSRAKMSAEEFWKKYFTSSMDVNWTVFKSAFVDQFTSLLILTPRSMEQLRRCLDKANRSRVSKYDFFRACGGSGKSPVSQVFDKLVVKDDNAVRSSSPRKSSETRFSTKLSEAADQDPPAAEPSRGRSSSRGAGSTRSRSTGKPPAEGATRVVKRRKSVGAVSPSSPRSPSHVPPRSPRTPRSGSPIHIGSMETPAELPGSSTFYTQYPAWYRNQVKLPPTAQAMIQHSDMSKEQIQRERYWSIVKTDERQSAASVSLAERGRQQTAAKKGPAKTKLKKQESRIILSPTARALISKQDQLAAAQQSTKTNAVTQPVPIVAKSEIGIQTENMQVAQTSTSKSGLSSNAPPARFAISKYLIQKQTPERPVHIPEANLLPPRVEPSSVPEQLHDNWTSEQRRIDFEGKTIQNEQKSDSIMDAESNRPLSEAERLQQLREQREQAAVEEIERQRREELHRYQRFQQTVAQEQLERDALQRRPAFGKDLSGRDLLNKQTVINGNEYHLKRELSHKESEDESFESERRQQELRAKQWRDFEARESDLLRQEQQKYKDFQQKHFGDIDLRPRDGPSPSDLNQTFSSRKASHRELNGYEYASSLSGASDRFSDRLNRVAETLSRIGPSAEQSIRSRSASPIQDRVDDFRHSNANLNGSGRQFTQSRSEPLRVRDDSLAAGQITERVAGFAVAEKLEPVAIKAFDHRSVYMTWQPSKQALSGQEYVLYRSQFNNQGERVADSVVEIPVGASLSYRDQPLQSNTLYGYIILAVKDRGFSTPSDVTFVRTADFKL
eukprot:GILJ01009653.1.p1 GENE.GILJ01009653.1~~GILJ01009653.1.p1  ORF type:complete len:968 (-),score=174.12 GILJ01009653.1:127-3030(-)